MLIEYDIEKIKSFLSDFNRMTGMSASIWDSEQNQLAFCPEKMPEYCALVKSSHTGKKRCLACDRKLLEDCLQAKKPVTRICHAGCADTAIPILLEENICGYIMFGQLRIRNSEKQNPAQLADALKLPRAALQTAHDNMTEWDMEKISATANILYCAAAYLLLNNCIRLTENELVSGINQYILQNLQNPLSVDLLCKEFHIPKNRLYALWKKYFDTTVSKYILDCRMEAAKKMLGNDDGLVRQICAQVGIADYNYFSKLFRKYYGISPKEYRKRFPLVP